jgi:acetyl esterase/lipase
VGVLPDGYEATKVSYDVSAIIAAGRGSVVAETRFLRSTRLGKLRWLVVAGVFVLVAAACSDTAEVVTTKVGPVAPPETEAPQAPTTRAPQAPTTTAPAARSTELTRDIAYTDAMQLDVYAPTEPGPWPVVIAVHAYGGSKSNMAPLAEAIASEGAVVFNLDVTMIEPFLTAIEQVACAVRFARATAGDHGGDPTRITVVGHSGGAAAGAVVALGGDDYEGDCIVTDGSALPDALVGYEGPYDWAIRVYDPRRLDPRLLEEENPELLEAINPYSHIGGNPNVVVRLIHGFDVDDTVAEVLPEVSVQFHQVLADAGYDVELVTLDDASHFDLLDATLEAFEVTVQQVLEVARG